jgi:hypothetical protein
LGVVFFFLLLVSSEVAMKGKCIMWKGLQWSITWLAVPENIDLERKQMEQERLWFWNVALKFVHMGTRLSIFCAWGREICPRWPHSGVPTQRGSFPNLVLINPRHAGATCPPRVLQDWNNLDGYKMNYRMFTGG